jgi:hypothetical protein
MGKTAGALSQPLTSISDVKNDWSHTSAPPMCLHGLDKDIFTFYRHILIRNKLRKISLEIIAGK